MKTYTGKFERGMEIVAYVGDSKRYRNKKFARENGTE